MPGLGIVHIQNNTHLDLVPENYALHDGMMTRVPTNSTSTRSLSGGFIETLGGSDNDEILRFIPIPIDLSKVGTAGQYRVVFAGTEANTNDAEWFFGISTGMATGDGVFSDTAGTLTSGDHFGIYKVAESLFHRTLCISTSTANAGETLTTAYASATEYALECHWVVKTTGITLRFYIDNVLVDTITDFSLTGVNVGFCGVVLKATSANAEVIRVEKFELGNKQGI